MSKEIIRFRGLSYSRDEQSAAHGELSLCAGVELHEGALRPSVLEGSEVSLSESNATLLYVHETASYRHYIAKKDARLLWFDKDGNEGSYDTPESSGTTGDDGPYTITVDSETLQQMMDNGEIPDDATYVRIDETHYEITFPGHTSDSPDSPVTNTSSIHTFDGDDIIDVKSLGNTLIVLAESGIHYILWKDGTYNYLGKHFPYLRMLFRPDGGHLAEYDHSTLSDTESVSGEKRVAFRELTPNSGDVYNGEDIHNDGGDATDDDRKRVRIMEDYQSYMTEAVQALVNQTNNKVAKDGHFYAPFLIRYCYRLYDGSMVMHSAPLFMNVSQPYTSRVYACNLVSWATDEQPEVYGIYGPKGTFGILGNFDVFDEFYQSPGDGCAFQSRHTLISYMPSNVGIEYSIPSLPQNLSDWSDIISSVDIFISRQFPREDYTEKITRCVKVETMSDLLGVRQASLNILAMKTNYADQQKTIRYETQRCAPFDANVVFDVKTLDDEEYLNMIRDTSNFFKLKSIDLKDVAATNGFTALEYDKYLVPIITTQEQMKDDYRSHYQLLPGDGHYGGYVYNHRLSLYGYNEKIFEGFILDQMVNVATNNDFPSITIKDIYVEVTTDDGTKYVHYKTETPVTTAQYLLCRSMLFYPDSRATKMYLKTDDDKFVIVDMKSHNFLNGAISTELFFESTVTKKDYAGTFQSGDIVPLASKVVTSEVDNPYYFPLEGRNTVGIGRIIGMAAVTRALSQGQVGDHDLVVFSTDGLWVMKVSSEGTYNSIHNISREVCTNPKSICQLDQAVVFATQRSLSMFFESNSLSISDMLDGPIPDWQTLLPKLWSTINGAGDAGVAEMLAFGTPAVKMFNEGSVFYDYAGARVIVLPDANATGTVAGTERRIVAMVYSTKEKTWSTMVLPAVRAVVPGYPSPFVQLGDGTIRILDKAYDYSDGNAHAGLVITRELTFSDTMDVIRGWRQYSDAAEAPAMFLFGSNDQRTWQPVGMSDRWVQNYLPGHPFRFWRVAIYMNLKPSEEYQQLQLEVVNKYTKL